MDLDLAHDVHQRRYTLTADGTTVAYADYRLVADDAIAVFHHTVTLPDHRGNGFAGELVRRALDDVRTTGRKVEPTCWYVAGFIEDHPEYADLRA